MEEEKNEQYIVTGKNVQHSNKILPHTSENGICPKLETTSTDNNAERKEL